MKLIRFALLFLFLAPGTALAAGTTMTARDLPRGTHSAHARFDLVGLHWQGIGTVSFRTRSVSGRWSGWHDAAPEDDRPDLRTRELRARGWQLGSPYWTGPSNRLQVRTSRGVTRLRAYYVWSPVKARPLRAVSIAGSPLILSRSSWGANEHIRRGPPHYADSVRFAIVHHTAGSNSYTRAQSASIVRGIQRYHVLGNGWDDIGYNFLVDKYGQIFEGRYGGVDRSVVGAHAQGFNSGSTGIALIGSYTDTPPSAAARDALTRLIAWRLDVAHVDPLSTLTYRSSGNPRFPAGRNIRLRSISGHRDTGYTTCPGNRLYAALPALTRSVAETGLPKLYSPVASGSPGGFVHFTATLTEALSWSVVVTEPDGNVVANGEGTGTDVDWTWDARTVPAGRYRYAIDAGPTLRPATGVVAGTSNQSALTALARPALITPNGDGLRERTVISYHLREASLVTATVVDSTGTPVTTLFVEQRSAGSFSFPWDATGLADGRYGIVLTARNALGIDTTATVSVTVDRTLAGLSAVPRVFSPNGDGRLDTIGFHFQLNGPAQVSLNVRLGQRVLGQVFAGPLEAGPQTIEWNGRFRRGAGEREYRADVRATSAVTTTRLTVPFAVDTTGPRLRLLSSTTLTFWVNEPSDVTAVFNGTRTVTRRRLRPGRFRIAPGGAYSTFRAVARDFAGNDGRVFTYP
ncbi:MAG TPA: N-acetylmuramoyl-L-alanine amidase [Gaiellaceae bacterium]|nr:N-acetylmuramoyl-L-alanine amidase [Gaiellaceae bacterium]